MTTVSKKFEHGHMAYRVADKVAKWLSSIVGVTEAHKEESFRWIPSHVSLKDEWDDWYDAVDWCDSYTNNYTNSIEALKGIQSVIDKDWAVFVLVSRKINVLSLVYEVAISVPDDVLATQLKLMFF